MTYDPPTGTITPDLAWAIRRSRRQGHHYESLEAYTYGDLEFMLYEDMENLGLSGVGRTLRGARSVRRADVAPDHQRRAQAGWLVVDVACTAQGAGPPRPGASRRGCRTLTTFARRGCSPWASPNEDDPFDNPV